MRVLVRTLCICGALLAAVGPCDAQDASGVGIAMGYPSAIGIHIPVSRVVTIRPEISFSGTSLEDVTVETSSWIVGLNVSALFYVHHDDRLRTYIAPRLEYGHAWIDASSSSIALPLLNSDRTTWGGSGLFGAHYSLSDRFGIFGEIGFGFSTSTLPGTILTATPTSKSWGTRTAVGIVFFP